MPRNQRIALLAVAALIAVVAVVALRPSDNDTAASTPEPTTTAEQQPATTGPTNTTDSTRATSAEPKPEPPLLIAGRERQLSFKKGDTVRFRVRHAAAEEVHVHGYDIAKDLPAGKTVTMSFKANLEGIFEVELEHSATHLGSLKVEP